MSSKVDSDRDAGERAESRYRNRVLAIATIGVFMGSFDTTVVNVAIEGITKGLHVKDPTQVAWVLSGYSIVYAATLLAAGRLADWKGRKRIFLVGMSCFGIGSALCGFAPTLWFLLAARVIQAAGAAMVTPASLALVLIAFPPAKRPTAVGIWGAVGSLAGAVAPVLGSLINRALQWRGIFFINIPFVIVALVAGRRVMKDSNDPNITKLPDLLGAILVTGGVGLIVYGIIESSDWGAASLKFALVLVAAAILIAIFFVRCRTVADPVLDVGLLRERFFAVANLAAVLYTFSFFGIFLINVRFFFHVWHYSEYSAGIALTPIPVTASLAGVFSGRFVRRLGTRRTATLSALCLGGGLFLMVALTGNRASYWTHAAAPMTLIGFGVGSAIAVLNTSATIHLPSDRFSMGSAFISTGRQIGAAIGVALALAIYSAVDRGADPLARAHLAWTVFAIAGMVAGLGLAVFYRPPRIDHHAPATLVSDH